MPSLNESCLLWLLYSCSNRKEGELLQRIPKYSLHYLRGRYAFKAKYARALLTCGLYDKASEYLKLFESDGYRFSDCNNILLDGLYQGGYYKECIETFERIQQAMKEHPQNSDGKPIVLYNVGYSAVLMSFCKLNDEQGMIRILHAMEGKNIVPREEAYYECCAYYDQSDSWKKKVERVIAICQKKGIVLSPAQTKMISARAREECFGEGVVIISDYCRKYDSILYRHSETKQLGQPCCDD